MLDTLTGGTFSRSSQRRRQQRQSQELIDQPSVAAMKQDTSRSKGSDSQNPGGSTARRAVPRDDRRLVVDAQTEVQEARQNAQAQAESSKAPSASTSTRNGKAREHLGGRMQSSIVSTSANDAGRAWSRRTAYLEGLRGYLTLCAMLALFFRIFAPALATDTGKFGEGPAPWSQFAPMWQETVRKVLGPILWDQTLVPHFLIILSGRVVAQSEYSFSKSESFRS